MAKFLIIFILLIFNIAMAGDAELSLGVPSYAGDGCPDGSARVALGYNSMTLSVLFNDYMTEAGSNGKELDQKTCNIAIPIYVPRGFSITIFGFDYTGYANISSGGQGLINAEYYFDDQRGPAFVKNFDGGYSDRYVFTKHLEQNDIIWSSCGRDVMLYSNTSMSVNSVANQDSKNVGSGIIYYLVWRTCEFH